jgi:hypothetical protein
MISAAMDLWSSEPRFKFLTIIAGGVTLLAVASSVLGGGSSGSSGSGNAPLPSFDAITGGHTKPTGAQTAPVPSVPSVITPSGPAAPGGQIVPPRHPGMNLPKPLDQQIEGGSLLERKAPTAPKPANAPADKPKPSVEGEKK